jgi:alpha-tubulin suppressor-like RCC1 family protein
MTFEDEPLPKRVETLYDEGVLAVGVSAGANQTMVVDADGAVWGFGYLNAIGAWNHPTVDAMRDAEDGTGDGDHNLFAYAEELDGDQNDEVLDCFDFLFPHGRASISMPVRIPVGVRGSALQGGALFVR